MPDTMPSVLDWKTLSLTYINNINYKIWYYHIVSFSETADSRALSPTHLTVQSAPAFPVDYRPLTGGNYSMALSPTIVLSLDLADLKHLLLLREHISGNGFHHRY